MTARNPKTLAIFSEQWESIMRCGQVSAGVSLPVLAQIIAAYSESHRHYHNLEHIVHMLDMRMMRNQQAGPCRRLILDLAVVFHDVVYESRRSDNEERSAGVARAVTRELGMSGLADRVSQLILMTKAHQAPDDDPDAQLLLDADLIILGMGPPAYAEYAQAIRREYEWVAEREYLLGRRRVLTGFLDRKAIYRTNSFKQWEAQARANLRAEIAQNDKILRTLPS